MISGHSFCYFGPEAWDSMWRNRHHLLSRLAQTNRVLYLEPWSYLRDVIKGLSQHQLGIIDFWRSSVRKVAGNLWVYRWPLFAPFGGGVLGQPITQMLRRLHLRLTLARLGMSRPIVWTSHPDHFLVRSDLPAILRVYHIVDEYLGYHGATAERQVRWTAWERGLIDWADLVVAVSPELIETKGHGSPKFHLLPNGVDLAAYAPERPADMARLLDGLAPPILGYVGLISVRLDLAMLDALAVAHPEWSLALIGTTYRAGCEAELARLTSRANVRLLPPVPAEEVPGYVRHFDLGLVPYRLTTETYHASPLKLNEYLAAGLPVVCADVPSAQPFATVARLIAQEAEPVRAAAAWGAAIAAGLAENIPEAAARRRAAVADCSWDTRLETLSGYLVEALGRR